MSNKRKIPSALQRILSTETKNASFDKTHWLKWIIFLTHCTLGFNFIFRLDSPVPCHVQKSSHPIVTPTKGNNLFL